jgi:hypothetical protein
MMLAAQLSLDDIAILEEAIDRALSLAAERGIDVAPGQLAAQLCEAFWNGERNRPVSQRPWLDRRVLH